LIFSVVKNLIYCLKQYHANRFDIAVIDRRRPKKREGDGLHTADGHKTRRKIRGFNILSKWEYEEVREKYKVWTPLVFPSFSPCTSLIRPCTPLSNEVRRECDRSTQS
jgi:hypothetical protein